jgi:predicted unusual protein kinase regulating ubiquinone biosynthesis (AarF/ABC1/UbiB family)
MGQSSRSSGFRLRRTGLPQALRLLGCLSLLLLAELWGRLTDRMASGRRDRRVEWQAERLVRTLGGLRGVFAKAGQFGAIRYDVVPGPVRERLAQLQDRVPPLPFEDVRSLVEFELGDPLETRFVEFDPLPLGAASIAQAHRARLPDGRTVVVKVQYPWLEASLPADLALLRALLWLASRGRRRSDLSRRRLFEEFAAGVGAELDFEREACAAEAIGHNLAGDARVVVPEIVRSHSTKRVLTMTHHPAVRINDLAALRRLGVEPREVLEILARAYAKQVFVDGFFHADPHPGNLFVIDDADAASRPRVLFVDFGLSKRLTPELRDEMRTGILALLSRDLEGFLNGMDRMGMIAPGARDGVSKAVATMFERLSGDAASPLALSGDRVLSLKDEAKQLLEETPGLQLPNDLLLYAKTLSHLFSLGAEIDPDVDLMRLSTPYLLRFLAQVSSPAAGRGGGPAGG